MIWTWTVPGIVAYVVLIDFITTVFDKQRQDLVPGVPACLQDLVSVVMVAKYVQV